MNVLFVSRLPPLVGCEEALTGLELLSELAPKAKVIALLVNPNSANTKRTTRDAQVAAREKGLQLRILEAGAENEFEAAFAPSYRWKPVHSSLATTQS